MTKQFFFSFIFTINVLFGFSQNEEHYKAEAIPADLKTYSNAVLRLNQLDIKIDSQDKMIFTLTRVITVLNKLGDQNVNAFVGYDKDRKIKKIQAIIFDEEGNQIKKIKKGDFVDHSAVDGGTLYSDSRVLFMAYTPIQYPYTVEFVCEIESPNTAAIPSWRPVETYYLGIEKTQYTLIDNANLGLRINEKHFDGFQIESNKTKNSISYIATNIKAFKPEDLGPSLHMFTPKAMIAVNKFHYSGVNGEASNWSEFGQWMNQELLSGRSQVSEDTKAKILELTANITNPLERAKKVYEFVQNNTRYISVQVGIGGIQPILASEVDQLKYGDCKGLTNYTQALLSIANVDSYYSVVQAGTEIEDFDEEFASLEQGNHIILSIPNDEKMIWIDCTSQYHPFGFIGDFTDGRNVLQIKPTESIIIKTSDYVNEDNYQFTKANAIIETDGSIQADVSIKSNGIQYDTKFLLERESDENISKYYKSYWSYINNLNLLKHSFVNDKSLVEFSEDVKLIAQSYASNSNNQLIFSPNAFNRNTYVPDRYRNRLMPLVIQRGYLDEDHFTFSIPKGYSIEGLPENFSINNKFGEYSVSFELEQDKIIFKKKLLIKKGVYPKTDYDSYREFRKEISRHDASMIVLKH